MKEATRIYRPHAGDVVAVDGRRVGDAGWLGEILESGGEPGHERLRVRWEDGRESVLYPGGDVRIRPKHREASMTSLTSNAPLGTETVADAMTSGVIRCRPDTPLRAVARMMAEHRVHAIYVFDYGEQDDETVALWGLVSDLDVVAAADADLDRLTARDSAVSPLVTITSTESLASAARSMAETGVSHLAVLDPVTGRPSGVLSTLDVVRCLADDGR